MPTRDDLYRQRFAAQRLRYRPTMSVVTPLFNTPPEALRRLLASVKNQTYPHWQHCLVDDGSAEPWIARTVERAAATDPRIAFKRRDRNGGIVAASNDALELASGEYVAFLDHDDQLDPEALFAVARTLGEAPQTDLIYSDADLVGADGIRHSPYFWPDWSPELLLALPYIAHLLVIRRTQDRDLGGFRAGLDGAQDYDLVLRVTEASARIAHIPRVLYHWWASEHSVVQNPDAKPYFVEAGRRAVDDALSRRQLIDAQRVSGPFLGAHRIRFGQADALPVSAIMVLPGQGECRVPRLPTSVAESLARIVRGTQYPSLELVVVTPVDRAADVRSALAGLTSTRVRVVDAADAPDEASAINLGASHATGEMLLILGADLEPLADDWLLEMVGFARHARIGAVGPKVYASTGTIEHAGIVLPKGTPHHVLRGEPGAIDGYMCSLRLTRNYSAVSGACLVTRRAIFHEVGGFRSATTVGFSDVDYCLRLREHGYRIVWTPHAELRYLHPTPAAHDLADAARLDTFRRAWSGLPTVDPYYNPSFDQCNGLFIMGLG
jgi:O-antigen biosynthesis protein